MPPESKGRAGLEPDPGRNVADAKLTERQKDERERVVVRTLTGAVSGTVKAVSYYNAITKVAQLAPVIVGLLLVALSPSAWLSGTLRRWGAWGMVAGGAIGALAFFVATRRGWDFRRIATWALALLVAALAVLRFHLALADVAFTERSAVLRAVHDYFIGTGDLQETLYNLLAAFLFALALFAATLGLPALGVALARDRRARAAAADDGASLEASRATLTTELARVFDALDTLRQENAVLRADNAALRRDLAGGGTAQPPTTSRQECSGS